MSCPDLGVVLGALAVLLAPVAWFVWLTIRDLRRELHTTEGYLADAIDGRELYHDQCRLLSGDDNYP